MKMKTKLLSLFAIAAMGLSFASCSDDDPTPSTETDDTQMQTVTDHYVNQIVIPVYTNLANATTNLLEAVEALQASRTDANVQRACEAWKSSRQWWEWSEAFLFGAATNYGIDPHIDTWPLDRTELEKLLKNQSQIESLTAESAGNNFGPGLLGFHGLEYIIFRDGQPRSASAISDNEMIYAVAVAGDLCYQTYRLEAAWAGIDNIAASKREILEDLEMEPTDNFGDYMINAGKAGSVYKTLGDAIEEMIDGCETIADEVAMTKIGKPYTGEDVNYIESPYSWNSLQDFEDNIRGIQFVYLGGLTGQQNSAKSLSTLIASKSIAADTAIRNAIDNAIAKIQACQHPFVQNYNTPAVQAAINACTELTDALHDAKNYIND
jgi:predicted lipoprotein